MLGYVCFPERSLAPIKWCFILRLNFSMTRFHWAKNALEKETSPRHIIFIDSHVDSENPYGWLICDICRWYMQVIFQYVLAFLLVLWHRHWKCQPLKIQAPTPVPSTWPDGWLMLPWSFKWNRPPFQWKSWRCRMWSPKDVEIVEKGD